MHDRWNETFCWLHLVDLVGHARVVSDPLYALRTPEYLMESSTAFIGHRSSVIGYLRHWLQPDDRCGLCCETLCSLQRCKPVARLYHPHPMDDAGVGSSLTNQARVLRRGSVLPYVLTYCLIVRRFRPNRWVLVGESNMRWHAICGVTSITTLFHLNSNVMQCRKQLESSPEHYNNDHINHISIVFEYRRCRFLRSVFAGNRTL